MEPYEFSTLDEYEQYAKDMNAAYVKYVLEQENTSNSGNVEENGED